MRAFKIILLPSIALLLYIVLLGTVFFGTSSIADIGTTIGLQIILFIFLHFSLIPFNKDTLLKLSIGTAIRGILLSIISLLILTHQHTVFLFLTHITFSIYFLTRYYSVASTKKRYYRSTSQQGLSIVSIMLAITYTATIWIAGATVNLSCSSLQQQSIGFLTKFIPSLHKDSGIIQWLGQIDTFGSQSIGEILGTAPSSSSGGNLVLKVHGGTGEMLTTIDLGTGTKSNGLLGSLLAYQESLVNGLINNQTIINAQVCDVTLSHINTISKNSDVQIIVFILLTLLLYVFMKTITFVIGIINYILFIILIQSGWFIRKHHKEEVEDITL